jgi:hypothetical protein
MRTAMAQGCLLGVALLLLTRPAMAQEPKSAPLAKQLAAALDAKKLTSVAAKDPSNADTYVGALYFPGLQLLTIAGKYSAPILLDERLGKHEYRDVYVELNGATTAGTKIFVEDLGIDGLRARRDNDRPADNYESAGKRIVFDGDWRKQQLEEQEYMKTFAAADERYAQLLTALLAAIK